MEKSWKSLKDFIFEGKTLVNAGYAGDAKDVGHKVSQFYVDKVEIGGITNHYSITWDFEEFYRNEGEHTFEWPTPHAFRLIEQEHYQITVDYFSGASFTPLKKTFELDGMILTIINRPVEFAPVAGSLRYYAGATDQRGKAYQVYWNMFNLFEPVEIELMVDNSKYCKYCLKRWTRHADSDTTCEHEWASTLD
ncbi:hypothetical protein [Paenibacillus terrae]|uniref:Uncharacterized protein n=1 Tax=Paenibacillus terrae TaxID=159743 RepID=A0A0D7WVY2_9BACL|nr:hypothetical protein [Paenibacillus terrae]KJD43315.1 hypothetical protein QD47_23455 [Paenibacillus terrae]